MTTAQASTSSARGWRERSPTKTAALRALLADGKKHSQQELQDVAGYRYGGRLFDAHHQTDFGTGEGPLHYEKIREHRDDARVFYRIADKDHCDICTREAKKKPSTVIAELRARVFELERRNQVLEQRLAYAEGK